MQKTLDITTIKKMSSLIAGNYKTSFRGLWIEFEDLRKYTLGDDIRNIDWNSSAKTGNLLIKKYEEERECSTIFIVDSGEHMQFGSEKKKKIDTLNEILLTLAFSAWTGWDAFWAYFLWKNNSEFLPIKKGKIQLALLLKKIEKFSNNYHLEEQNNTRIEKKEKSISIDSHATLKMMNNNFSLNNAIEILYKQKTRNKLLFFLTDYFLDESCFPQIRALAQSNDLVWFHIFDRFENTLSAEVTTHIIQNWENLTITPNKEKQQQYIELRKNKLKQFENSIRSSGGDYLFFDDTDNVFKKLYDFFKKRQSRK